MSELYSRVASASLIKESVAGTALTPNVFFEMLSEGLSTEYQYTPSTPVVANRTNNIRAVTNIIPAPAGNISINVEPKQFGHFLNGVFGGVISGNIMYIESASGAFTIGETVTGGSSTETATVLAEGEDYLILGSASGAFTVGETITGGTSTETADVVSFATTAYGHHGVLPQDSLPTYTLQINYLETAIRFYGTRFHAFDSIAQSDNMITADVQCMALGQFRHAYVTEAVTSGAGSKTITVDQTKGLVAADVVKIFRPGTGFIDFSATGVKTHAVGTVASATTITVTNLEANINVGDLLVLAPQTPSYTVGREFTWIGGTEFRFGDTLATVALDCAEDFNLTVSNEFEERHGACGANFENLFPKSLLQKGLQASGQFTKFYNDEAKYSKLRRHVSQAIRFDTFGDEIGSTDIRNRVRFTYPSVQFDSYQTNITEDEIVNEEVPFTAFYDSTSLYAVKGLLVNDVASY